MESPLSLIFIALRAVVCILTVIYIRVVVKGVKNGQKLESIMQYHERGHVKPKNTEKERLK